jgi:hypothetical protein
VPSGDGILKNMSVLPLEGWMRAMSEFLRLFTQSLQTDGDQPNQSVDPNAGQPNQSVDPNAGQPNQSVDPNAGQPSQSVDPNAGQPNQSVDPNASQPNQSTDPNAGQTPSSDQTADANAQRAAYLDQQYRGWLAEQNWELAAENLNGFNTQDIQQRLNELSTEQIANLHQGALDNPRVGPGSNVAKMTITSDKIDPPGPPEELSEKVERILSGAEAINTVAEAANLIVESEALEAAQAPVGAVLKIVGMVMGVLHALDLPKRTLRYQGYSYTLVRACCQMSDPAPNSGWPDPYDVGNDYSNFDEAVSKAKSDLANVEFKNRMLLQIAKKTPASVLVEIWQTIIPEDDRLIKMITPRWSDVAPG